MNEEIAGRIADAYKSSPLLTGLLLLNLVLIGGFGWWEHNRTSKVETFIYQQLEQQAALRERLIDMAKDCVRGRT